MICVVDQETKLQLRLNRHRYKYKWYIIYLSKMMTKNEFRKWNWIIPTVLRSIWLTTSAPLYSLSLKSAPHLLYFPMSLDNVPLTSSGFSIKYEIKLPQIEPIKTSFYCHIKQQIIAQTWLKKHKEYAKKSINNNIFMNMSCLSINRSCLC
jgi:hypothetical protein